MGSFEAINGVNQFVGFGIEDLHFKVLFCGREKPVAFEIDSKVVEIAVLQIGQRNGLQKLHRRLRGRLHGLLWLSLGSHRQSYEQPGEEQTFNSIHLTPPLLNLWPHSDLALDGFRTRLPPLCPKPKCMTEDLDDQAGYPKKSQCQ